MNTLLMLYPHSMSTCGNSTTMTRIGTNLKKKHLPNIERIIESSVEDFCSTKDFQQYLIRNRVKFFITLQARHAACIVRDVKCPYTLIFGGTDVNESTNDEENLESMWAVIKDASAVICFGYSIKQKALENWPDINPSKLHVIPQGVRTSPSTDFDLRNFLSENLDLRPKLIYLLLAQIRPVKDPLYLVKCFSDWHQNNHRDAYLLIAGPKIESSFYSEVEDVVDRSPGVLLLDPFSQWDAQAAIRQSTAVVNSSKSEGMSSALLEAMDLQTPVIARNIPGNEDIIDHMETGLLYETPEDFIEAIETLKTDEGLGQRLIEAAAESVKRKHSCECEVEAYARLYCNVMKPENPCNNKYFCD